MSNHAPWRKQRLGSRPPIVPNQTYSVQEAAAALGVAPIAATASRLARANVDYSDSTAANNALIYPNVYAKAWDPFTSPGIRGT